MFTARNVKLSLWGWLWGKRGVSNDGCMKVWWSEFHWRIDNWLFVWAWRVTLGRGGTTVFTDVWQRRLRNRGGRIRNLIGYKAGWLGWSRCVFCVRFVCAFWMICGWICCCKVNIVKKERICELECMQKLWPCVEWILWMDLAYAKKSK